MLRITSPIGRTGLPATIRVVARLDRAAPIGGPVRVRFSVDGEPLAIDDDGPPYETTWVDDNPFESRTLAAEAELPSGARVRDTVVLEPLNLTDAVRVTSVTVDVWVHGPDGRAVTDLAGEDFSLSEDGRPQALDQATARRLPALVALVVDSSQSLATRSVDVRATAAEIVDALGPEDQLLVAPFSRRITSITGPTTDRDTVLGAIRQIRHAGGTAIADALRQVATSLRDRTRRLAVVLITDGYDEHSESDPRSAAEALRAIGATAYVVGIGGIAGLSLKGEDLLSDLAEATGGRAWFPRSAGHLRQAYEAIAADVRQQYFLTYTPHNQRQDGTWRTIEIAVRRPGVTIRARPGYRAPMAPPIRAALEFAAVSTELEPIALSGHDLSVFEDGVEQPIDTFHEAVLPVRVMLALDSSGSMRRHAEAAQAAARGFVAALRPEDEIGMLTFADGVDPVHPPTTARGHAYDAIDAYTAAGGTALHDALFEALSYLQKTDGRRVVVLVTDGRDENADSTGPGSLRTWDEVMRKVQDVEATVYAIGIGAQVNRAALRHVAERSGGAAYFPADAATLDAEYQRIVDELRRRYVVGWLSTNRERNGEWRAVEIRAAPPGVSIRSRAGYYAPAQ